MKNYILSIILLCPIFLLAQNDSNRTFKFAPVTKNEDSSNKEFYENYKKGIAFYNKAVDIINKTEPGDKPDSIDKMQVEAKEQFKLALPFLEKAYSINSKNEKTLIALQGTNFGLYDFEKSDRYKKELEALNKK